MFVIGEKDILGDSDKFSERSRSGLIHTFSETELQVSEKKTGTF